MKSRKPLKETSLIIILIFSNQSMSILSLYWNWPIKKATIFSDRELVSPLTTLPVKMPEVKKISYFQKNQDEAGPPWFDAMQYNSSRCSLGMRPIIGGYRPNEMEVEISNR